MSWDEIQLGEVIDFQNGYAFKSRFFTEDQNDIPLIKGENLGHGEVLWNKSKYWSRSETNGLDKFYLKPNDVLLAMDRPWVGGGLKFAFIKEEDPESLLVQRVGRLRAKPDLMTSKFLRYVVSSPANTIYLKNIMSGVAVPHISPDEIKSFKFKLPPLPTQQKIASILSAYDDLIENNLKRIKLLEEAAQNLYREWFVEMRFPGHESAKFGEDGQPEGWEKVNLYDIAEIQMGFPFKADDFNEAGIGSPAIRIRDIPNQWTSTYTTQEAKDEYKTSKGDIVVGMDGFFYTDVWCGQDNAYLVQRVCRLRANDPKLQGYLLEALKGPIEFFEKTISGATVAHLGAKHLKEIFITQPITETQKELEVFNSLMQLKIKLRSQIVSLKEARDILLPRLMNQTIEV